MKDRSRYIWLTDTHLLPWQRYKLLNRILDEKPAGVIITGDISHAGFLLLGDLEFLGKRIGRPLYFVLGNHDLWLSSFNEIHQGIRNLCAKYKNLVWMNEAGIVPLNEETAVIGHDGWYSADGNVEFLKYTFDWFMIKDFKKLSSMKERIEKFKELAYQSAQYLSTILETAINQYKTVYLLSHMPPWREAHRAKGWISDAFYEPYNTNNILGEKLEKVMAKHKKRRLIVFSGHTHLSQTIYPARNIECRVGKGSYNRILDEEIIYI